MTSRGDASVPIPQSSHEVCEILARNLDLLQGAAFPGMKTDSLQKSVEADVAKLDSIILKEQDAVCLSRKRRVAERFMRDAAGVAELVQA